VFENRVLRRIFGPQRDEITGDWRRRLLTEYYPGDKNEKAEMGEACSTYGWEERCIQGFGGKSEGKRPLKTQCIVQSIMLNKF